MKRYLMTQTNLSSESGRSMVEILGVLAIVGVLSIGGIAGYRFAMAKYQANEILENVVQRAVLASAAVLSPTNKHGQGICCGFSMELPREVGSFEYDAYCYDYQTIRILASKVPQDTCHVILQNRPEGLVGFRINDSGISCWDCGGGMECSGTLECDETNKIEFRFDVELASF